MKLFRYPRIFDLLFPNRVWRIKDGDAVYLTFDDGPTETTRWVLDLLKEEEIHATFFCVGNNLLRNPDLKDRILNEGHILGSHTMSHERATKTKVTAYSDSVESALELAGSALFRPPYGRLPLAHKLRLPKEAKIIMWSWLSYDFDENVTPGKILERLKSVKPGDILVFHDNEKVDQRIREILPSVIESLKMKGLTFGTISA